MDGEPIQAKAADELPQRAQVFQDYLIRRALTAQWKARQAQWKARQAQREARQIRRHTALLCQLSNDGRRHGAPNL
jgi:hypothetical protein